MDPKLLILSLLIVATVVIASPSSLPEDHSVTLMRTKIDDNCRYFLGWCGTQKCCAHLRCNGFLFCFWDGNFS
uniref:LolToxH n=1 Tax=Bichromomyia olmeca TaxID=715919 RepID=A0A1B1V3H0_9DIPT|nr:LolToxH [Bichromomyia olmeca]